jgi:hypothetical protein
MAMPFVFLVVLLLVVVAIGAAVIRHEGDLFAWSRHPVTRIVFGVVGLFLVALVVVPEIRTALTGAPEPARVTITVPVESIGERFPFTSTDTPGQRSSTTWTNGTLMANWLYVDGHGRVLTNDSAVLQWDAAEPLLLEGDRELMGQAFSYRVRIDKISIALQEDSRSLELTGKSRVTIRYGGGSSGSSGGLGSASAGEMFLFDGQLNRKSAGGLQLRRRAQRGKIARMVLLLHPLDRSDAPTRTVDATTYLAPQLGQVLEGVTRRDYRSNYNSYRNMDRTPQFFAFLSRVGPGALVLAVGLLLLAFTPRSGRALSALAALLLTSVTLIGVDGFSTSRALARAANTELTVAQQADAIESAAATFFHAGVVAEKAHELMAEHTLGAEATTAAWRAIVANELRANYKLHRPGMQQIASGYDHDGGHTWYTVHALNQPAGETSHLVLFPEAHLNQNALVWSRASLAAAHVPPGIYVVVKGSDYGAVPTDFVHVGSAQEIHDTTLMLADQSVFLKSKLWRERIVPALK